MGVIYLPYAPDDAFYKVIEKLTEKRFGIEDLYFRSEVLEHYSSEGLLHHNDFLSINGYQFTAVQVAWLNILSDLLDLGFSKEYIITLRYSLETYLYHDIFSAKNYDVLTYHLALMLSRKMDFRIILNKEMVDWTIRSNTNTIVLCSNDRFSKITTITLPLLPTINNIWETITGKDVQLIKQEYILLSGAEKKFVKEIRKKDFMQIELKFHSIKGSDGNGTGVVVKRIPVEQVKMLCRYLRTKTYSDIRISYREEPGVPVGITEGQSIKFVNLDDAINQIEGCTKRPKPSE